MITEKYFHWRYITTPHPYHNHTPPLIPSGSQVGRQAGQDGGGGSSSKDRPQILTRSTGKASPWQPPGGRRCPAGCRRRASAGRDRAPYSVPGPHSSHPAGNFRRAADIQLAAGVVPPPAASVPGPARKILSAQVMKGAF